MVGKRFNGYECRRNRFGAAQTLPGTSDYHFPKLAWLSKHAHGRNRYMTGLNWDTELDNAGRRHTGSRDTCDRASLLPTGVNMRRHHTPDNPDSN